MTDELLGFVRSELEQRHPVLAAMATKIERRPFTPGDTSLGLSITFDGPALPEKRVAELLVPYPAVSDGWKLAVDPWLFACERDVAAQMKRAGYAGGAV